MGLEEKEREEKYWAEFAETGHMPPLPESLVDAKGEVYARTILRGSYNPLTRFLIGEVLAKRGLLDEQDVVAHVQALGWIKPMIFSKKKAYPRRAEMAASFESMASTSANPKVVSLIGADIAYQKAWEWVKRGKGVYSQIGGPALGVSVSAYIHELSELTHSLAWTKITQDTQLYSSILFWLGKILCKAKGNISGGENHVLLILTKVDPSALPEECYARKTREPKPAKGKDYYPSTLEELAVGLYGIFKAKSGLLKDVTEQQKKWLLWAVDFLMKVYSRFEDEWGDFRIGKLLVWSGDSERAKSYILPTARKKPFEFWVWPLMADLFPDKRVNCLARALTCPADEKYTVRVKREALDLGIKIDDKKTLETLAESTDELLLDGINPIKGVYLKSFVLERDGKHIPRVVFVGEHGEPFRPVSPVQKRFPKGLDYGTPVWLYTDPENAQQILAVKLREDASIWDVLPTKDAIYLHSFKNKSGGVSHVLAEGQNEFVVPIVMPAVTPGCLVKLRMAPSGRQDDKSQICVSANVMASEEEVPFSRLPSVDATYCGVTRSGLCQFTDGTREYTAKGDAVKTTDMTLGAVYTLRYTCRDVKGETIYNVWSVLASEQKSDLIGSSEGVLRLGAGDGAPSFVENVFVPQEIVCKLKDRGIDLTIPMHVVFVRISPQDKTDRFGQHYKKKRFNAISCEPLYGEELERYRCEHTV